MLHFLHYSRTLQVILWCQEMLGKEYLVDGKVRGKDVNSTRSPQRYGFTDLDTFMKANQYMDPPSAEESAKAASSEAIVQEAAMTSQ